MNMVKDAFYGILTGGAVFGFAIGYASKDIVSNMLSDIMMAIDKPFRRGEPDNGCRNYRSSERHNPSDY